MLLDPNTFEERDAGIEAVDRLGFHDDRPYPDRLEAARVKTGLRDAAGVGDRRDRGRPGRDRDLRLPVHGRQHGKRRRREARALLRDRAGRADPGDRGQRLGRRADAGGHAVAHAAVEDDGSARPARRIRRPVHRRPHRSDHRRRPRQLREPRRRHPRRAQGAHRLRGRARRLRHGRRGAARGLPDRRVPPRARLRRRGRAASGAACQPGPAPAPPAGARRRGCGARRRGARVGTDRRPLRVRRAPGRRGERDDRHRRRGRAGWQRPRSRVGCRDARRRSPTRRSHARERDHRADRRSGPRGHRGGVAARPARAASAAAADPRPDPAHLRPGSSSSTGIGPSATIPRSSAGRRCSRGAR